MDSWDNPCSPWGHKELDVTGQLRTHTHRCWVQQGIQGEASSQHDRAGRHVSTVGSRPCPKMQVCAEEGGSNHMNQQSHALVYTQEKQKLA